MNTTPKAIFRALLSIALLTYLALASIPAPPPAVSTGLDPSWMWALNMAHQKGFIWGKDIVYTFGPFGYLSVPIFPFTGWVSAFRFDLVTFLVRVWIMVALVRRVKPYWTAILTVTLLELASVLLSPFRPDQLELAAIGLALLSFTPGSGFAEGIIFGLVSAFCLLSKFNVGVEVAGLFFCYLGLLQVRSKNSQSQEAKLAYSSLTAFVFGLMILFCFSGASLRDLPLYFWSMLPTVQGYNEAMQVPGPPWRVYLALAQLCALVAAVLFAKKTASLRPVLLPGFILCFLFFKEGVVRHEAGVLTLKLVIPTLFFLVYTTSRRDRIIFASIACLTLCAGVVAYRDYLPPFFQAGVDRLSQKNTLSLANAFLHFRSTARATEVTTRQLLQPRLLDSAVLSAINNQSVDVIPQYTDYVPANQLKWAPRPSFASYFTYSPQLDHWNSDFIRSGKAPHNIIFGWETLDFRNRLSDDPQTMLAVLNWYDLKLSRASFFLLVRRETPRFSEKIDAGSTSVRWDQAIKIPTSTPSELLLMSARIEKSFSGAVLNLLFRIPEVLLDANLHSGARVRGRLVVANLSNMIVSDWPRDLGESAVFFDQQTMAYSDRVSTISFRTVGQAYFKPVIQIHWYRIRRRN